ncbi:MAG: hypothetical protein IKX23_01745 [Treponema sp.]|nr:hypothetical protein [Treponema sp.]
MKKILFILSLCLLLCSEFSASSYAIKFEKLPEEENMSFYYSQFTKNEQYSSSWVSEWKHPVAKEQVIDELQQCDEYFSSLAKSNYESMLTDLTIKAYLYNLDAIKWQEVDDYASMLKKKYPKEYRTYWITANFYLSSKIDLAYPEFQKAIKVRGGLEKKDDFGPDFLIDYAVCTRSCRMKQTAMYALSLLTKIYNIPKENINAYRFVDPVNEQSDINSKYDYKKVWNYSEVSDKEVAFNNSLMGFTATIPSDSTDLQLDGYSEKTSILMFTMPAEHTASGEEITSTFLTLMYCASSSDDSLTAYSNKVIGNFSKYPSAKITKKAKKINGYNATVYNIDNPDLYNDELKKGARGIVIVLEVPYKEFAGKDKEVPFIYENAEGKKQGNMTIFSNPGRLNRLKAPVYFVFLLDTCNAVYKEAEKQFYDIISKISFE